MKRGMDLSKKIRKWLYRSLDGTLRPRVKKRLETALARSPGLRAERKQILAEREEIAYGAARSFEPLFAERVWNRIQSQDQPTEPFYESLKIVFRRFAVAGAIVVILLLSYNLGKKNSLHSDEIFYTADVTVENLLQLPLL